MWWSDMRHKSIPVPIPPPFLGHNSVLITFCHANKIHHVQVPSIVKRLLQNNYIIDQIFMIESSSPINTTYHATWQTPSKHKSRVLDHWFRILCIGLELIISFVSWVNLGCSIHMSISISKPMSTLYYQLTWTSLNKKSCLLAAVHYSSIEISNEWIGYECRQFHSSAIMQYNITSISLSRAKDLVKWSFM